MLLFGTPIMLCSAPLQCFDQVFGKIAHHELGHASHRDELLMLAMLSQRDQAMQAVLAMVRTGHLPPVAAFPVQPFERPLLSRNLLRNRERHGLKVDRPSGLLAK